MERHPVRPVAAEPVALPPAWRRGLVTLAAAGVAVTLLGLVLHPERAWPNLLLAAFYALGVALGGLLFVAFAYVTKAGWSVALRRVPEALAATLPLGVVAMIVALLGVPWLYEWSHPEAVAADHLLQEKQAWLNVPFFALRAALCFLVWLGFAAVILRLSRRQDERRDFAPTRRNVVWSTLFLVVFALTFSAASFDWIMSIEPHWFSTVFALYHITGMFLAALAATTVFGIALRRLGPFRGLLRPDHLHDLGRLTLGFATFWAYLWYSQHMLIWYGNIPEETAYYVTRQAGAWGPLLVLNLVVNWLVPFLVLLPRAAKRSEGVMLNVALLLLAGRWLDLYLAILPPFLPEPRLGAWEIAPVAAALSATAFAAFRLLGRHNLVPKGDPYLTESL